MSTVPPAPDTARIHRVMVLLQEAAPQWGVPVVGVVAHRTRDPFQILVSCLLILRTWDESTAEASRRLFTLARTPEALLRLPVPRIEAAIRPVGFYRTKARRLKELAQVLVERFRGKVPGDLETLLTLPGVGRKTAVQPLSRGVRVSPHRSGTEPMINTPGVVLTFLAWRIL